MKLAKLVLFLAMLAVATGVGCRKRPTGLTYIPGQDPKISQSDNTSDAIRPVDSDRLRQLSPDDGSRTRILPPGEDDPARRIGERIDGPENREALAAQTVLFDFDKSAIKPSERAKLDAVGAYLKNNTSVTLKIEGHCDERGTEEYNRALGERRAIAARDYLVQSQGIDSTRITTVSFGEDKPADPGHDEAAFTKNRRAEFVVLGTGSQ